MGKNLIMTEWPIKRRAIQERIDPEFKKFILNEYPGISIPEATRRLHDEIKRTRRILDGLLYNNKK